MVHTQTSFKITLLAASFWRFFVFTLCDQVNVRWGDDRYGYFRFRCHHCPHFRRHKLGEEKKYFYIIILLYTFSLKKNIGRNSRFDRELLWPEFGDIGQTYGTLGRHFRHRKLGEEKILLLLLSQTMTRLSTHYLHYSLGPYSYQIS